MLLLLESIGTGEVFVILLFILIFFGAESIPGLARNFGRGIRQIKDATQDIQQEIMKSTTEIKREMNANKALQDVQDTFKKPLEDLSKDIENSGKDIERSLEDSVADNPANKSSKITPPSSNTPLDQMGLD